MRPALIAMLALLAAPSTLMAEDVVTPEAQAAIEKALAEMGCTSYEIEPTEAGGYEADDSQCKDGQYDIIFDKEFKVVEKRKE